MSKLTTTITQITEVLHDRKVSVKFPYNDVDGITNTQFEEIVDRVCESTRPGNKVTIKATRASAIRSRQREASERTLYVTVYAGDKRKTAFVVGPQGDIHDLHYNARFESRM